jgi:uncharacterized membrane protein YbhN (UPF0104 family)
MPLRSFLKKLSSKRLFKFFIRTLITTVLLIWVFNQIDLKQFWQAVMSVRWHLLLVIWGLNIVMFWIWSVKMQLILKKLGCYVGMFTLFGANAVTRLYSMVLPGFLSTGVKWFILRKNTGKGSSVFSSMLYNQISLLLVMAAVGPIAIIIDNPVSLLPRGAEARWLLPLIATLLLIVVLLSSYLLLSKHIAGKIEIFLKLSPKKFRSKASEVLDHIELFRKAPLTFHLMITLITLISVLILAVFIYPLAAKAAHITLPLATFVWLCSLIFILGRIPISIANLGVREVTLVGVLALYGVGKSEALLMSMVIFSTHVFMAVIGALFQLYWAVTVKKK